MKIKEMCKVLVDRYERSRIEGEGEPPWVLSPFDIAYGYMEGGIEAVRHAIDADEDSSTEELESMVEESLGGLLVADGSVCRGGGIFPDRVIHDGFKIGTTSWVFMGRASSPVHKVATPKNGPYRGAEMYVVGRAIPKELQRMIVRPHPELDPVVYCGYFFKDGSSRGNKHVPNVGFVEVGPCMTLSEVEDVVEGRGRVTIKTMKM